MDDEMLSDHGVSCFQKKTTAKEHGQGKGWTLKKCVFCWENGGTGSIQSTPTLDIVMMVSFLSHVACPTLQSLLCRAFIMSWSQHSRSADLEPTRAKFGSGNDVFPSESKGGLRSALLKMRGCRDQRTVHNMRNRASHPLASVS